MKRIDVIQIGIYIYIYIYMSTRLPVTLMCSYGISLKRIRYIFFYLLKAWYQLYTFTITSYFNKSVGHSEFLSRNMMNRYIVHIRTS
jgi:hypothetical protein